MNISQREKLIIESFQPTLDKLENRTILTEGVIETIISKVKGKAQEIGNSLQANGKLQTLIQKVEQAIGKPAAQLQFADINKANIQKVISAFNTVNEDNKTVEGIVNFLGVGGAISTLIGLAGIPVAAVAGIIALIICFLFKDAHTWGNKASN